MNSVDDALSILCARPVVDALERAHRDADQVLRAAGLSRAALADVSNRVPRSLVLDLWERGALAAKDASFGIHVAEQLPKGAYDVIEYLFSTSATLSEGLSRLSDYMRLIYEPSNMRFTSEAHAGRLERRVTTPCRHFDEFFWTLVVMRGREACALDWAPRSVAFQHWRAHHDGELERVFRCPLEFGQPTGALLVPGELLTAPHVQTDSRLLSILLRYADSLLAARPDRGDPVALVASELVQQLTRGVPTLRSVAAALKQPERTLQRRLAEHGVSHSSLLDGVRRDLALKHIADASLSIGEIGYLLQFADPAAFHRAFKRWTGESPQAHRGRLFGARRSEE